MRLCNIFGHESLIGDVMTPASAIFKEQLLAALPKARTYARTLTKNEAEVQDLVQAAIEKALNHSASYEEGTHFGAWLNRIIKNTFLDIKKSHSVSRTEAVGDDQGRLEVSGGLENTAMDQIEIKEIQEFLFTLPETDRSIVMLWAEGYSYEEISEELGISRGNAGVILCRARKALAVRFRPGGLAA